MVRAEGWLQVALTAEEPAKKHFVTMEGYVLRVFDESWQSKLSYSAAIVPPIDMRRVEQLTSNVDAPDRGPCQLTCGKQSLTLATYSGMPSGTQDDTWWIRHLASAVPDHIVAPSLRAKCRDNDLVLALIQEHARQESAHGLTDKAWLEQVNTPRARPTGPAQKHPYCAGAPGCPPERLTQDKGEAVDVTDGEPSAHTKPPLPKLAPLPPASKELARQGSARPGSARLLLRAVGVNLEDWVM
jgi:hypothetical protein